MNIATKGFFALGIAAALGAAATPGAFAKAHNQGATPVPGANVGQETVSTSQTLGAVKRNENAPDKPARVQPAGKSAAAGREALSPE